VSSILDFLLDLSIFHPRVASQGILCGKGQTE
jgi:hypothetical protein